jgi:hypothetical protein
MQKRLAAVLALLVFAAPARAAEPFEEVFYRSGALHIQAYLYRPASPGRVPLVIYNHGSRAGAERRSMPFRYVGSQAGGALTWPRSFALRAAPAEGSAIWGPDMIAFLNRHLRSE